MVEEVVMALRPIGVIEIPAAAGSAFDHGAFEPVTRRVFIAHTARDCVDVIDRDPGRHIATLPGFPEAAGVVADRGQVIVTNRSVASVAWIDARSLKTRSVVETGARPNGVAIVPRSELAAVACIGDDSRGPELHVVGPDAGPRHSIALPGRPRWCVTDADGTRLFLAIREPSMVLVARLPALHDVQHWPLPSHGAHGMDIDHRAGLLYVACDAGALIAVDTATGRVRGEWPIGENPDATFFNPTTGLVHVAIAEPGLIQSIDPGTGSRAELPTAFGAKTTAFAAPDRLYVFSPKHGGALVCEDR
jgi:DNA-binding beta-propeller fold protein YncE